MVVDVIGRNFSIFHILIKIYKEKEIFLLIFLLNLLDYKLANNFCKRRAMLYKIIGTV